MAWYSWSVERGNYLPESWINPTAHPCKYTFILITLSWGDFYFVCYSTGSRQRPTLRPFSYLSWETKFSHEAVCSSKYKTPMALLLASLSYPALWRWCWLHLSCYFPHNQYHYSYQQVPTLPWWPVWLFLPRRTLLLLTFLISVLYFLKSNSA